MNLVALVILLLDGENFLAREEDVFVTVLGVPLEGMLSSCLSHFLQSRSKEMSFSVEVHSHVQIIPDVT